MTRYFEFLTYVPTSYPVDKKLLLKLEGIRKVQEHPSSDLAIIDGVEVKEKYEDVKKIIESEDRNIIFDDGVDFRIKELIRMGGVTGIYRTFGKLAADFMKEILEADMDQKIYRIQTSFHDKLEGN